jgi:hypothetical protein
VWNRAYPAKFRAAVLKQVQARYADFGPTLAAEHLASDDGLEVHAETLRRWLKEARGGRSNGGGSRIDSGGKRKRTLAS